MIVTQFSLCFFIVIELVAASIGANHTEIETFINCVTVGNPNLYNYTVHSGSLIVQPHSRRTLDTSAIDKQIWGCMTKCGAYLNVLLSSNEDYEDDLYNSKPLNSAGVEDILREGVSKKGPRRGIIEQPGFVIRNVISHENEFGVHGKVFRPSTE